MLYTIYNYPVIFSCLVTMEQPVVDEWFNHKRAGGGGRSLT